MERLYTHIIKEHFAQYPEKMLFLAGPRQVGKTTVAQSLQNSKVPYFYLNWDNQDHQILILSGPNAVAEHVNLLTLADQATMVIFDEIHKYKDWKNFLKGFYDTYKSRTQIIVTGSARLNIYKKGGDSLMGRYFPYRMHPVTLREALDTTLPDAKLIRPPLKPKKDLLDTLLRNGGFPEPYIQDSENFNRRWQKLRHEQFFRDDIRDLSQVQDLQQIELLATFLQQYAGNLTQYANLAKIVRVSIDTVRRWIDLLESLYYCYRVRPYATNIKRSLLKEPKVFLWDWSLVKDQGARIENMVANHLFKYCHLLTDLGHGNFDLFFLRDKQKHEVDFLVTRDEDPWILLEVKTSQQNPISPNLYHFQEQIKAPHVFQVVYNMPFVNKDCFAETQPITVPMSTLLSQLV